MSRTINGYEVLVDQLTVHREVALLRGGDGTVVGRQNGGGRTYFRGEIIPTAAVSPDYQEALSDPSNPMYAAVSKKLKAVSDQPFEDTKVRLGIPFDGYEDMAEEEVLAAMKNLPSPAIQRIKEYEGQHENRDRIVDYNIGFGESPADRSAGLVGSESGEPDPDKAVSEISTREVPESGPVISGEGITGTGEPSVKPGTKKAASKPASGGGLKQARTKARSGRRDRQADSSVGEGEGSGDDSAAEAS